MSENTNKLNNTSSKISNSAKPFTIWDDLAQSNVLIEYVRRFNNSNINKLPELQETVLDSIYNYSTEVAVEVESFYCKKYYLSLKNFLEKTQSCRQNLAKQLAQK